jgi:hypothetical protein
MKEQDFAAADADQTCAISLQWNQHDTVETFRAHVTVSTP